MLALSNIFFDIIPITIPVGIENIKRYGKKILGHKYGDVVIDYLTARKKIYIPTYNKMIVKYLSDEMFELLELCRKNKVAFLDFETNDNVEDLSKPLSHASLIITMLKKMHDKY